MSKKAARSSARAGVAAGRKHRPVKTADASAALLDEMARQRNRLELQNEELRRAHANLEISHQRFSELHEQAPVGYLTFDAQGCIREINVAATALLGVARAYVIGKPFIIYVEKADRKAFLDHLWKVRRATSTVAADLRLAARTGAAVRVQMTTGRHRDTEGHSSLFLSAIEDVTVLRDASVTAAYLASIVESSQEQIISYSPNGMIRSWNRGAQRILGYSAAEIIGKHVSVIVPEDCRAEFERNFLGAKAGGVMPSHDTFRRHRDGSLVPMALTFSPITEAGKVIAVIVIGRNISERKRAEAALRESESRFRLMADSAPVLIWISDVDKLCTWVNQQWLDFVGRPMERELGYGWVEHVHPDDRKHCAGIYSAAFDARRDFEMEYRLRRHDGEWRWILDTGIPRSGSDGTFCGYIGSCVDITERKKDEEEIRNLNAELEERVAARTAALQNSNEALKRAIDDRQRLENEIIEISETEQKRIAQDLHDDLGQQLAGIWFMSLLMQKRLEAQSSPEAASAKRIAGFLDTSLNLTRSLARGLHPVPSEPGGLLVALKELAARSSELFAIRCSVACRTTVQIMDSTMATHLYRIAQEAVTNAVKHGAAKRIEIALSSAPGKIVLSVSDNGKGTKKPDAGHNGLGVRIMNYRAETLGGSLIFRGRPRGGTSVVCTIPTAEKPAQKEH